VRVAIVGLGAVGGLIAVRLAGAGVDVCALARGATLEAVRSRGLELIDATGAGAAPVRQDIFASDDPARLGSVDVVILSVKAPALPAVAHSVAALCSANTTIVAAMNGVPWWFFHGLDPALAARRWQSIDPDGGLSERMPVERVLGAVLHLGASTPAPGTVRLATAPRIILGEPRGGESERLDSLARVLGTAGLQVECSRRIQHDVWFKLWGNMTMNPVSALTGATADKLLDDPLVRDFLSRAMTEASKIGARIGLPIATSPEERHQVTRHVGAFKTSMLQDVEAGRPIELDALVGAVQEIGQAVGVATPFIDALYGMTRLFARTRGLYPQ
jgi:2-dehydropantoate 2-reductase